ncbi:histone PARylation factor 1-like [Condylostylus longicornis]|uniref:histone PARylation factor 1-like n=1 Tax=Condylostylus longicornis TaxID=2530218 RepID=UPI00244E43A3|nr:histone PARylation factor 1-like [Condylostylus longicornis]
MNKKENCKYWDKCYQKNEAHISKYNHPPKSQEGRSTQLDVPGNRNRKSPSPSSHKRSPRGRSSSKSPEKHSTRERSRSPVSNSRNDASLEFRQKLNENLLDENNKSTPETVNHNQSVNVEDKHYFKIFHNSVHNSKKDEYVELLKTTDFIRHKFLVEMPDEFYTFWAFCSSLTKADQKPEEVFKNLGLQLVGPFEYLSGSFNNADIKEPGSYLRHWRFFYDPPEFQTIFIKKKSGVHYGYWRDDPSEKENLLIARNDVNKGCAIDFIAINCFQALIYFMDHDFTCTPFNMTEVKKIKESIKKFSGENNINLENFEDMRRERDKKVVTKTFHKAGVVVPYDRKTQLGYRPLMETDSNIKKILNKLADVQGNKETLTSVMESLQPIITAANIAVDESDFGTALELGIDLFCSGHKELHEIIVSLLVPAYSTLKRPQFIAILKAHLEFRQKGNCLSIFEVDE